jgi:hypothetical protein
MGATQLTAFRLRFGHAQIPQLADSYWSEARESEKQLEDKILDTIAPECKARGYVSKDELLEMCRWKSPRTRSHCARNDDDFVRETTGIALSTSCERLRIEVLTLLRGVHWPTASVLLHFTHRERYPILDFRALWSANAKVPQQYTFEFWQAYTLFSRQLADRCFVDMRTLDRALWQYSKERQR